MNKRVLNMRILDWWNEDNEVNFYSNALIQLLQQKYDVAYSNTPDFILCGPFGYKHLEYDCVRIFYTGENVRPDFNLVDYAISFDYAVFEDRHLHAPLIFFNTYRSKELQNTLKSRIHLSKYKTKFCGFVASNSYMTEVRDNFFEALCAYKNVDSGGKWKNNIGASVDDKIEWLKSYKFNICFENSSYPGYLTEKLFDAFMGGCVPIYWGDTSLKCGIDKECNETSNKDSKKDISPEVCTSNFFTRNYKYDENLDSNAMGGGGEYGIFDTRIPNIPPYLFDYKINPKAFINAHEFPTLKDLIDEIKRIDDNDKAFRDMLNEPIFLDDFDPQEFYSQRVFHFLDYIVSQGPTCAKRIGRGSYLQRKENVMKTCPYNLDSSITPKFMHYCMKHRNFIENIRKISEFPRDIIRIMRGK